MLEITGKIAGMLWAAPMVVLILGVGLLFTVGCLLYTSWIYLGLY